MKGHAFVDSQARRHTWGFEEEFVDDIDSTRYTVTATDSGTGAVAGGFGGILPLVASDGTVADNDETYVESVNEYVTFAANCPWHLCGWIQFTEANVDDANIAFGLATGPGANTLVDNGAGIDTSLTSVAVIYKVDGSNVWKCTAGGSAAQQVANVKTSINPASPGVAGITGPWQWVEIIHTPISSTTGKVTFRVDGQDLMESDGAGNTKRIELLVTYSGSTTMAWFAGVKNGGANLETLNVDYFGIWGRRTARLAG